MRKPRIVVVEDVALEAKLLLRTLFNFGYTSVVHFSDVSSALGHIALEEPEIVITDLSLGAQSGFDLTRAIRAGASNSYTYVIVLTGMDSRIREAFGAGVDDFVLKPFRPEELLARLRAGERMLARESRLQRREKRLRPDAAPQMGPVPSRPPLVRPLRNEHDDAECATSELGRPENAAGDAALAIEPGDVVDGKYRIVRFVGKGGMGAVYEGRNIRLDRPVAIKVMKASIARDVRAVARFEREAQAAARLGSRHIVDVFDLGLLPNGEQYIVMEYLDGETLETRLRRVGTLPTKKSVRLAIQLLEGLAKVHHAGIVHRDLKPANVFLSQDDDEVDLVKILDFGVCKFDSEGGGKGGSFTGSGDLLGTLGYVAPEQLEKGPIDADVRSDIYAVGVLLYRSMAGRLPYPSANASELFLAIREGRLAPLAEIVHDVDPTLSSIVERALASDPTDRFQDARSLQHALLAWTQSMRLGSVAESPRRTKTGVTGVTRRVWGLSDARAETVFDGVDAASGWDDD
jgi:serine/threonine protein kinase/CheY-like chemotaxis protein